MGYSCKNCGYPLRAGPVLNYWFQLMWCSNEECGIVQIVKISEGDENANAQMSQPQMSGGDEPSKHNG